MLANECRRKRIVGSNRVHGETHAIEDRTRSIDWGVPDGGSGPSCRNR